MLAEVALIWSVGYKTGFFAPAEISHSVGDEGSLL